MKIVKRKTVIDVGHGVKIEQEGWMILGKQLIQSEFKVNWPAERQRAHDIGAIGLFVSNKIDSIRFIISPSDIFENLSNYADQWCAEIEFSGKIGEPDDNWGFSHKLAANIGFDQNEGWTFQFEQGPSHMWNVPQDDDEVITAEDIAANIVCSYEFKITLSRPTLFKNIPANEQFAVAILRDVEGLRLAISDTVGVEYLQKLLRKNGFEIDSGP